MNQTSTSPTLPSTRAKRSARPYSKGTVGQVIAEGHGRYQVESFSRRGDFYAVDLNDRTCNCPDHLKRVAPIRRKGELAQGCKHHVAAEAEAFRLTWHAAMAVPTEKLQQLLVRGGHRPEQIHAMQSVIRLRAISQCAGHGI